MFSYFLCITDSSRRLDKKLQRKFEKSSFVSNDDFSSPFMEQCTLDAIGVLIISPTAGGGGLGRLRCNVDSEGGKYTSASPLCTCLPPRQHCAEVALGASTTDSAAMLTQREASTPRPSPRCTCLPPRQHCVEVALGGKQVHLGFASEYLLSSSCNFNSSPPRPSPSSPRLRLGLGGLERSQWVGTSCN